MHTTSDRMSEGANVLKNAIFFEYDIDKDSINFSDNVSQFIPIPLNVTSFVENIESRGKVFNEDLKRAISFFTGIPKKGKVKMEYVRFIGFRGEFFWYQLKGKLNSDVVKESHILSGTITYIDEIKDANEELLRNRDSLTGLLAFDAFGKLTDDYIAGMPEEVIPGMMILDIDDFEELREMKDAISSDGILFEIARILKNGFRGSDIIGRVGVDRFGVFMKGVRNTNILEERATYVKKTVKDVWKELDCSLTVSIGISVMYREEANSKALYERALSALEEAKKSGKDTYVICDRNMQKMTNLVDAVLTTREMTLVTEILDPMCSWAYAVDEEYNMIYRNEMLNDQLKNDCKGLCYVQNKGYDEPCQDCPIKHLGQNKSVYDAKIYSPTLKDEIPCRATKINVRNGKNIYLIASTKENVEKQEEVISESMRRVGHAVVAMQDLIWDVDIEKNSCIRIKEENIKSIMDKRIKNYQTLRDYFIENVIYPEDRAAFVEATDPKYLKQAKRLGVELLCREVRLKNVLGDFNWYNVYAVFNEEKSFRVLIICLNVDEYVKHRLEEMETKVKYEIMKEKSDILKEIALSNERHENVNEMTGILVYEYTVADGEYYLCPMFDDVFDIDKKKLKDAWSIVNMLRVYEDDEQNFKEFIELVKNRGITRKITLRLYNRNNVAIWYTIIIQPLHGLNNQVVRYLATFQNVDAEMRIKMEMEYKAEYDSLTGLYNPETFYEKAMSYINLHEKSQLAIISVDIDKFRMINDRYGIEIGNKCLALLGKHLKEVLPKGFVAGRYQGDMFSILYEYESDQKLLVFIDKLSEIMRDEKELPTSVSLVYGIYKIVDRNVPVRLMCDRARAVKKQVKGTAMCNYAVYDDVIRLKMREQAEIESEMEKALLNNEFVMYLQPQINISTGKLSGAEALVRWKHPKKGVLVPANFLPLFENNGFITRLDIYMWREACKYIANLQSRGINIPISVNVSRLHVGQTDIVGMISDMVNEYGFEPRFLEIEITENLFMDDVSELFEEMNELKKKGFRILMDDFGSGYSSLNMLRKAPIDTLKIDRFFLDEIMATERGKIIVESSVRMAKMIGMDVIAEGVETKEQLDFLASVNCDIAQGYYYSRPIPIEEFEEFIKGYM